MAKYLTLDGLTRFYEGLKEKFLSATLKDNYDSAYTHSQSAHAPSSAQVNVIESVKRNGVALAATSKEVDISVPTKVSELTNDSAFITKAVSDLTSYYTKTETYSKTEVQGLVNAVSTMTLLKVSALPTSNISTTTIYLVPKTSAGAENIYTEYVYIDNKWEKIGDTDIDLSGYAKTSDIVAITNAEIDTILAG